MNLITILEKINNRDIFRTFDAYLSKKLDNVPHEVVRKYRKLTKTEKKYINSYELFVELPKCSTIEFTVIISEYI